MSAPPHPDWLPAWVQRLGFACWLCDPEGRIAYWNACAEALLEQRADDVVGRPCHGVVRGTDCAGQRVCGPDCRVARLARQGSPLAPVTFRRAASEPSRGWMLVATIPLTAPDGSEPWLLHCAHDAGACGYVQRLAQRTARHASRQAVAALSRREREVLELLAQDEDSKRVARRLHISHATVRNHIQHIIGKLGVHSVQEAIAWLLLEEAEPV